MDRIYLRTRVGGTVELNFRNVLEPMTVQVNFKSSFYAFEREEKNKEERIKQEREAQQQASASSSGSQPAETSNPPQEPDSKQKEQEDQEEEKPASTFSVSEKGLYFIAKHEGWQPKIYGDPAPKQYPTIGYGHQVFPSERAQFDGRELTKAEGWELLKKDAHERAGKFVGQYVQVGLLQHQFDALSSLTFNIGATNFIKESSVLQNVNKEIHKQGQDGQEEIRRNFMLWVGKKGDPILPGLPIRRGHEANLFLNGVYDY